MFDIKPETVTAAIEGIKPEINPAIKTFVDELARKYDLKEILQALLVGRKITITLE